MHDAHSTTPLLCNCCTEILLGCEHEDQKNTVLQLAVRVPTYKRRQK